MDRRCCRAVAVKAASVSRFNRSALSSGATTPVTEPLATNSGGRTAFPKSRRLAKRREFLRVYDTGQKVHSRYAVLFWARNDQPHSRLGITATKKIGKANVRNRVKRWTREIYRQQREPLGIDSRMVDVVVNLKNNAVQTTFEEFRRELTRALARVVTEAGR
ncbi:MAG TPA: ribonuclease P protein component [Thermoanaerobaculia bacterium]